MKWRWLCIIVLFLPSLALAQSTVTIQLKFEPVWEYTDGTPADRTIFDHYRLYICDAPIIAGGESADNPILDGPACVGQLDTIQVKTSDTEAKYAVKERQGKIYLRLSIMPKDSIESRLSIQSEVPYDTTRQLKAPILVVVPPPSGGN